jgi:hypothetical protein
MCERLANATRELLAAHQKLYEDESYESTGVKYHLDEVKVSYPDKSSLKSHSSSVTSSPLSPINQLNRSEGPQLSTLLGVPTESTNPVPTYSQPQQPRNTYRQNDYYMPSPPSANTSSGPQTLYHQSQQNPSETTALSSIYSNSNRGNEIDFNSLEFLYDTGLFGQVVFDVNSGNAGNAPQQMPPYPPQQQQPIYQNMMQSSSSQPFLTTSIPISSDSSKNNPTSAFNQPMMPQNTSPTTYNPSKSLWN